MRFIISIIIYIDKKSRRAKSFIDIDYNTYDKSHSTTKNFNKKLNTDKIDKQD
jgi:hypothetical protein